MKNMRIAILGSAAILLAASTARAGEMDLMLRSVTKGAASEKFLKSLKSYAGVVPSVPVLIKSRDPVLTAGAVEAAGGRAGGRAGSVVAARVPLDAAAEIAARPEVIVAEAAVPLSRKMDTARAYSRVDVVQNGSALGTAYDGANVVVGDVDDGLDYGNPDFTNSDGFTRVQYVQQDTGSEVVECTKWAIMDDYCDIEDGGQGTTHGTHVTGIAAGSNETWTGVAPAADIMFIFLSAESPETSDSDTGSFSTAVLNGVAKIFEKADTLDKAAVVNVSLGTSIGAHDGTSLLEEGLTSMTGAKVGRIVVNAAGNEQVVPAEFSAGARDYIGGIHASVDNSDGENLAHRVGIWSGSGSASSYYGGTLVDVWLTAGQKDSCKIAVLGYANGRSSNDFTFPGLTSTSAATLATGDVSFASDTSSAVTATGGSVTASIEVQSADPRNGKPHALVLIKPSTLSSLALESQWFDVVIRASGGPCTGNMWLYYDYTPYHDFLKNIEGKGFDVGGSGANAAYTLADGDSLMTMTVPATAVGVIAAGSWMPPKPYGNSLSLWTGDNGQTYSQSDITAPGGTGSVTGDTSDFSSLGPTADGRTKPDIVAPGEPIVSTLARAVTESESITVGGEHYKSAGTSMASPHAASIVALLLQRNNTLSFDAVRTALKTGADPSNMTAKTPDPANTYGAGRVNAESVLGSVGVDTSAYSGTGDLDAGSSGCGQIAGRGGALSGRLAAVLLVVLALPALLAMRRRRA